jgi:hypothetical protein
LFAISIIDNKSILKNVFVLQPAKRCSHAFDPERGEEAEEDEDTRTHTSLGSCELNWSRSSLQDELLQSVSFPFSPKCIESQRARFFTAADLHKKMFARAGF